MGPQGHPFPFFLDCQCSCIFHSLNWMWSVFSKALPPPSHSSCQYLSLPATLYTPPPSAPGYTFHAHEIWLWFHSLHGCNWSSVLISCHITLKKSFLFSSLSLTGSSRWTCGSCPEVLFNIQIASDQGLSLLSEKGQQIWVPSSSPRLLSTFPLLSYIFRGFNLAPRVVQRFYSITNKYRHMTSFLSKGCFTKGGLGDGWGAGQPTKP